jgi:hypothetical protein
LHPQGYRFAGGHQVKLELLPSDAPYSRPSNLQGPITVSSLELRLPVLEQPGSLGGLVQNPAPPGRAPKPAAGRTTEVPGAAGLAGRLRASLKAVKVPMRCNGGDCEGQLTITIRKRVLTQGSYSLASGTRHQIRLRLTKAGRRTISFHRHAGEHSLPIRLHLVDTGRAEPVSLSRWLRIR